LGPENRPQPALYLVEGFEPARTSEPLLRNRSFNSFAISAGIRINCRRRYTPKRGGVRRRDRAGKVDERRPLNLE